MLEICPYTYLGMSVTNSTLTLLALLCCLTSFSAVAQDAGAEAEDPFETAGLVERASGGGTPSGVLSIQDDNNSVRQGPYSFNFFSLISTDGVTHKQEKPQWSSYNYIGVNYRINFDEQISLRPAFNYNTPGRNRFGTYDEGGIIMGDTYFQYANFNALNLPGGISTVAQYRWYFPTGQNSRDRKTFGIAQGWFTFTRSLPHKMQLNYHVRPRYWFQSRTAGINKFNYADGTPGASIRGNPKYEWNHYLQLGKILSTNWAVLLDAGMTNRESYASEVNDIRPQRTEEINLAVGFRYNFNMRTNFILSISDNIRTKYARRPIKLGRDEEMNYALLTFIRL